MSGFDQTLLRRDPHRPNDTIVQEDPTQVVGALRYTSC